MKKWTKIGAIIGGIWGFISVIQVIFNPVGTLSYTFYEKIAFFPYWLEMTVIYRTPLGVINYFAPIAFLFIIFEGALIGMLIGLLYEKWRESKIGAGSGRLIDTKTERNKFRKDAFIKFVDKVKTKPRIGLILLVIGIVLIGIWQAWQVGILKIIIRSCHQDEDCISTCTFDCINRNSIYKEEILCEWVPECECVNNQCVEKQLPSKVTITTANGIEGYINQEVNVLGNLYCTESKVPCRIEFDDGTSLALSTDISDREYEGQKVSLIAQVYQCKFPDQCSDIILTDVRNVSLAIEPSEEIYREGELIKFSVNAKVKLWTNELPFKIVNDEGEPVELKHSCAGILGSGFDQYCKFWKIVSKDVYQLCDFSEKWCRGCSDAIFQREKNVDEIFVWDQKEYVEITEECEGKTIHREVKKQVPAGKYQIIVNGKVVKEFTIK